MVIRNIKNAKGDFIKRSYTFLNSEGKIVTRAFEKPETAAKALTTEAAKMQGTIKGIKDASERRRFEESLCDLMIAISNCTGPYANITFRREPRIEIR